MTTLRNANFSLNTKSLSLRDFQLLETLTADILREPRLADMILRYVDDRQLGHTTLKEELYYLRNLVGDVNDLSERLAKVSNLSADTSPCRAVVVDTAKRMAQRYKNW